MKPKRFKYIYLLLCVALCITTISRGYYLKHHTNEGNPFSRAINTIIPEAIPGINHVIDDSLSDLEETKKRNAPSNALWRNGRSKAPRWPL